MKKIFYAFLFCYLGFLMSAQYSSIRNRDQEFGCRNTDRFRPTFNNRRKNHDHRRIIEKSRNKRNNGQHTCLRLHDRCFLLRQKFLYQLSQRSRLPDSFTAPSQASMKSIADSAEYSPKFFISNPPHPDQGASAERPQEARSRSC